MTQKIVKLGSWIVVFARGDRQVLKVVRLEKKGKVTDWEGYAIASKERWDDLNNAEKAALALSQEKNIKSLFHNVEKVKS